MVAVQVRDVPDSVKESLSVEANRRGESLQVYLLQVLTREAAAAKNRRLIAEWAEAPLTDADTDFTKLIRADREEHDRRFVEPAPSHRAAS